MKEAFERELAVFSAARRLPPAERALYLDQTCAGEPDLRRRVEELLRASQDAEDFLQDPAPGAERPEGAPAASTLVLNEAAPGEKAGDRIGRYKLLQLIGEGGCGLVYMAEQEEPVRRRVALKVIKLGMDTKQVIARFEAERQALALMDHPNIARVLDAGATETGRPYFVMELVRGIKITDYCDEHNLSTKERLELFMQVCHAVQHAHQKGIIHRDIKPSNILVARPGPDSSGVPKVIDFGIAKATQGRLTDQTLFTAFEQFIGTPAYMSPEQAELTMQDVDTRTDIYSLGVLLYELLAGRTPFDAEGLVASGLDAMRRTIREQEPERPSTKLSTLLEGELTATARHRHTDAPKLVHLLRGDLDWIVMKCLEKDRARRYETASGVAMDIRRHLNNQPIEACPPSKLYRFRKSIQRNKLAFMATGAVIAALAVGLCIASWALVRERAARREAESAHNHKLGALKFLISVLNPDLRARQDPATLRAMMDAFSQRLRVDSRNEPEVEGDIWMSLANGYASVGDYPGAITNSLEALNAYHAAFGSDHIKVALALDRLAKFQSANKEWSKGRTNAQLAVAVARKCANPDLLAVCLLDAGKLFSDSGHSTSEAIPLLREALQLRRDVVPNLMACIDSTRSLVKALQDLARKGKQDEAEAILQEELKESPADSDLLRLRELFNGARTETNGPPETQ
jgi:serine/threonine protein kinase